MRTSSKWGKFLLLSSLWPWSSLSIVPKNNRDLNPGLLHFWSKFGNSSLNGWWVIARTSSWLTDTQTHKRIHTRTQRQYPKSKTVWWPFIQSNHIRFSVVSVLWSTSQWGGHFVMLHDKYTLQWRHNGRDGVSNHQPHDCLLNVYSDADQRKYQSSASLAFVRGSHRDRLILRTNGQQRGKCFHYMTSSC